MGYVEDIRALVGSRLVVLVGCAALIFDAQRRVLLMRRGDTGQWSIVGGIMEPGETPQQTVRREAREEVGVELESVTPFGILAGPEAFVTYPNGDECFTVGLGFLAHCPEPALRVDGAEALEAGWFALSDLPPNLSARTSLYLRSYSGEPDVPSLLRIGPSR